MIPDILLNTKEGGRIPEPTAQPQVDPSSWQTTHAEARVWILLLTEPRAALLKPYLPAALPALLHPFRSRCASLHRRA